MGGAASLRAATLDPQLCDALIIDSSYAQLDAEIRHTFSHHSGLPTYPFLPLIQFLARMLHGLDMSKMRPIDFIQSVRMPVMLIHSAIDTVVPTENSLQLYERAINAGRTVKLWVTPPCWHAHMHDHHTELYKKKVDSFLRKTIQV